MSSALPAASHGGAAASSPHEPIGSAGAGVGADDRHGCSDGSSRGGGDRSGRGGGEDDVAKANPFAVVLGDAAADLDGAATADATGGSCLERSVLCRNPLVAFFQWLVPSGGVVSNMFNLASGTLGIGIVSMPTGFHGTGVVLSAMLLVLCGACTAFSFYLIAKVVQRTGVRSWEECARVLFFRGADYLVAFILFVFVFGTCIGYVIAIHDLLAPFLTGDDVNAFLRTGHGRRLMTALVWLLGMVPLSLPKRVNSLRYFSIAGVAIVVFFAACVVYHAVAAGLPRRGEMTLVATGMDAVNGFTLFIFAFLCHGLAFRMANEMPVTSPRKFAQSCAGSVTLVGTLYFVTGLFGYMEIGAQVSGSIFKYYDPRTETLMTVAYIGIMLKICVAYALCMLATRETVYYLLRLGTAANVATWLNVLVTCLLAVGSLVLGLFIPNITTVFNVLGSICGGTLGFLLPALFVMYAGRWGWRTVGALEYGGAYLLILGGVIAIVFGTAMTIYSLL